MAVRRCLENVYGPGRDDRDNRQRDDRLEHHADLGPAGQDGGVGWRKGRACIECQEEIVHEVRCPPGVDLNRIFDRISLGFLGARFVVRQHLRKQESALDFSGGRFPAQRSAGVQLPIPQSEHQHIREPQRHRGAQQSLGGFTVLRNTIDQENQILIRKINALEERVDLLEHQ